MSKEIATYSIEAQQKYITQVLSLGGKNAKETLRVLCVVKSDIQEVLENRMPVTRRHELEQYHQDSIEERSTIAWKSLSYCLDNIIRSFPYGNIYASARGKSVKNDNIFLKSFMNKEEYFLFGKLVADKPEWKKFSEILTNFEQYDYSELEKYGFIAKRLPEKYQSNLDNTIILDNNLFEKKLEETQKRANEVETAGTSLFETKKKFNALSPKDKKNEIVDITASTMLGISFLTITAGMFLGAGVAVAGLVGVVVSFGIHLFDTSDRHNYSVKVVPGEVVETKVHAPASLGSNFVDTIKTFLSSIDNQVEASINKKIQESFEAAQKLHDNKFLDTQTRDEIDLLVTQKFIPSVEMYMQASSFAPSAYEAAWVEDTFRNHLAEINAEIERLNESVFAIRKEQMEIQSIYLSSPKSDDSLKISKDKK